MKPQVINKKRNKLLAVFLGLALPGLGQIYNSELVKGVSYFIITLSLIINGFRLTGLLPDGMLFFGVLLTLLVTKTARSWFTEYPRSEAHVGRIQAACPTYPILE